MKRGKKKHDLKRLVESIALTLEELLGTPKPASKKAKPLDMLIATILSQNTNDQNSYRAYLNLRERFPTWEEVRDARASTIISAIKTGGMANQKSMRIIKLLKELTEKFGTLDLSFLKNKSNEEVFSFLTSLEGVGPKTASCVLLFSLGREVFPVDTHIFRICNRLGLTTGSKTPEQTFLDMQHRIPEGKAYTFHTNLIRFGRKICKAQAPRCRDCPFYKICVFEEKEYFYNQRTKNQKEKEYDFMLLDNVTL